MCRITIKIKLINLYNKYFPSLKINILINALKDNSIMLLI